ncbi:alpha/beta hydrolase [Streptomyces subrutilus]|uniref:Alpha/beta hydrolase n=1 Tax=Streptomyces subrutilus TaxID=36818 RepID=A0A5P2UE35_9ACTN|nr:alpha/beta hydrolase [Streptomyces subrutilus]QEU77482.1 alpha/beta hydrolase [Streptomyces subrutilus]GGZ47845.1 alpha/beta hydrolase [Streptomyces subrutilus]
MAIVDTGGVRLHVQRLAPRPAAPGAAAGATVVLLHGLLTDSLASYYFTVAPAFAAAGLDVVMYDHRGHGRSGRPDRGYTLGAFVDDLDALLDRLDVRMPVHLVGNSYGGTVAFGHALRRPERVASMVVIESEPATPAWAAKLAGLLERVRHEMSVNESAALDWIAAHHGGHTARLAKSAGRLVRDTTLARDIPASAVLGDDDIRAVHCPVLALYGADSDLAAQAPRMRSLLPHCATELLPGHRHSVLVEAPGRVRDLVLDWVGRHSRPAAALRGRAR